MPKRKLQEAWDESKEEAPEQISASATETNEEDLDPPRRTDIQLNCSNDRAHIPSTSSAVCTLVNDDNDNQSYPAKYKKSVRFSDVTVYLFPRTQGFTCVPSSGGTTLGMTFEHCATKSLTLSEHEQECRVSKLQLSMKLRQPETSESDEEEVTDEEADGDEESDHEDDEEEDGEYEDAEDPCIFPIAIPMRHRRNLLKEAGCLVDNTERIDCQFIRSSREACGCQCVTVCNPEECSCSLNKIKCQVDRYSYPCGCTKDGCHNESGRVEFNPARVKTHYLNTVSRLATANTESVVESQVLQQSYSCYTDTNVTPLEAYPSQESYVPPPQCDYSYTSLSSSNSYQMQASNVSVSMSVQSYSSIRQPSYDYYNVESAYHSENACSSPISTTNQSVLCTRSSSEYICMGSGDCSYYCNTTTPQMISPILEFGHSNEIYHTLPPVSYAHLNLENNEHTHPYDSSPSDGGSGDSSGMERTSAAMDFGELLKQSLVETVTA